MFALPHAVPDIQKFPYFYVNSSLVLNSPLCSRFQGLVYLDDIPWKMEARSLLPGIPDEKYLPVNNNNNANPCAETVENHRRSPVLLVFSLYRAGDTATAPTRGVALNESNIMSLLRRNGI